MAAHPGALVHSYLDDGAAMQFTTTAVTWAGRRWSCTSSRACSAPGSPTVTAALCRTRAPRDVGLALDDLRGGDSIGSMVYGDTVAYGPTASATWPCSASVTADVATQLRRPTGHAITLSR